jgi:hypothetical protein
MALLEGCGEWKRSFWTNTFMAQEFTEEDKMYQDWTYKTEELIHQKDKTQSMQPCT